MNPERFKKDTINVEVSDTEKVELPLVFYRNLVFALKLSDKFKKTYIERFGSEDAFINFLRERGNVDKFEKLFNNELYNNALIKFNCHIFFFRCLGFNISFKNLKNLPYKSAYEFQLFHNDEYINCPSLKKITEVANKKFEELDTKVLAVQIKDKYMELNHSLFFIKMGDEIYVADKSGFIGLTNYCKLQNYFNDYYYSNVSNIYGNNFAFADWYEIATNPKIHKIFQEELDKIYDK